MNTRWKEVCKFLSGAFFVSGGVIAYLTATHVQVPLFGHVYASLVSYPRSAVHLLASLVCFYIGYIRK